MKFREEKVWIKKVAKFSGKIPKVDIKNLLFAVENAILLPIKIIRNSSKIIFIGTLYYGVFVIFKQVNKDEIKIGNLNNNDNKK